MKAYYKVDFHYEKSKDKGFYAYATNTKGDWLVNEEGDKYLVEDEDGELTLLKIIHRDGSRLLLPDDRTIAKTTPVTLEEVQKEFPDFEG